MIGYIKKSFMRTTIWLVSFFLLAIGQPSFSQQLSVDVSYSPATSLTIGDLDFKAFGSNHWLFTFNITYPGNHPNMQMTGELNVVLSDGTPISNPAMTLITDPFDVNNQRTVTNLDIGKSSDIKTQSFDYNSDAKDKIQKLALGTGKLPAGTYTFHMVITDLDAPAQSVAKDIVLNLENLSRMDLIMPQDGMDVPTPFPLFQWQYDGPDVQLSVYEKKQRHHSREEAASGVPQLQVRTGTPEFPSGSKSFQYPATGARPLDPGKTYVWKVVGLTGGSGGSEQQIPSEIWEFTVTNANGHGGNDTTGLNEGLGFLNGLGEDILRQLLNGDLTPTGVMYLDGQSISVHEGKALLNNLVTNPDKIIKIELIEH
jgi:hypothetical protein